GLRNLVARNCGRYGCNRNIEFGRGYSILAVKRTEVCQQHGKVPREPVVSSDGQVLLPSWQRLMEVFAKSVAKSCLRLSSSSLRRADCPHRDEAQAQGLS